MEKLNLPPFYAGQKVVCIKDWPQYGLIKDKVYTITGVLKCTCGWVGVYYGVKNMDSFGFTCYVGGQPNEWCTEPDKFVPIQEQKFPLITLSKIQELEKEEILISN